MKLVILESPFAGSSKWRLVRLWQRWRNVRYARECMKDCLERGEAPMVSHLLYPQVLDDNKPAERQLGIDAGLAWRAVAEKSVVYDDFGISKGMQYGMDRAIASGITVELRSIGWGEGKCR